MSDLPLCSAQSSEGSQSSQSPQAEITVLVDCDSQHDGDFRFFYFTVPADLVQPGSEGKSLLPMPDGSATFHEYIWNLAVVEFNTLFDQDHHFDPQDVMHIMAIFSGSVKPFWSDML